MVCLKCGSHNLVKNGLVNGYQRYLCREKKCRYNFSRGGYKDKFFAVEEEFNQLLFSKVSVPAIASELGLNRSTVYRWIKKHCGCYLNNGCVRAIQLMMEGINSADISEILGVDQIVIDIWVKEFGNVRMKDLPRITLKEFSSSRKKQIKFNEDSICEFTFRPNPYSKIGLSVVSGPYIFFDHYDYKIMKACQLFLNGLEIELPDAAGQNFKYINEFIKNFKLDDILGRIPSSFKIRSEKKDYFEAAINDSTTKFSFKSNDLTLIEDNCRT